MQRQSRSLELRPAPLKNRGKAKSARFCLGWQFCVGSVSWRETFEDRCEKKYRAEGRGGACIFGGCGLLSTR